MDAPAISAASLRQSLASARPPLVIDVRKVPTFLGALYAWCGKGKDEVHSWNPDHYR